MRLRSPTNLHPSGANMGPRLGSGNCGVLDCSQKPLPRFVKASAPLLWPNGAEPA